jgi:hypothetical protein
MFYRYIAMLSVLGLGRMTFASYQRIPEQKQQQMRQLQAVQFQEIKARLLQVLTAKIAHKMQADEPAGWELVDGFFHQDVQPATLPQGSIVLGGKMLPVVAVLGKTTGQLYYYALNVLLREMEIELIG